MKYLSPIFDFFSFIPVLLFGWFRLLIRFFQFGFSFWMTLPVLNRVLSVFLFIQFLFTTRPWFEYSVRFVDVPEHIYVSSKSNLWFILLSLFGLIYVSGIIRHIASKFMISVFQLCILSLLIVGYLSPSLIHVDFLNQTDYKFSMNLYIFLFGYVPALLLSVYSALQKEEVL